jgi:hypothetical protein
MAGISKAEREALAAVKERFETKELQNGTAEAAESLRKLFAKVAAEVHRTVPEGRNKSLSLTALEDGCMRAVRGLAHDTVPGQAEAPAIEAPDGDDAPAVDAPPAEKPKRRPRSRRNAATEVTVS